MGTLQPGQPTDNIPHELDQPVATEIAAGVLLQTLDGSKIGNAIVIKQIIKSSSEAMDDWLKANNQKLWLIETDFGNRCNVCDQEIHTMFGLGWQSDYDRWFDARLALIEKGIRS